MTEQEKEISNMAKALGRKGGSSTLKKYGKGHFSKMAKARWSKKNQDDKQER
jgi:hypothetical protein